MCTKQITPIGAYPRIGLFKIGNPFDKWTCRGINNLAYEELLVYSGDRSSISLTTSTHQLKGRAFPLLGLRFQVMFLDNLLRRLYNLLFEFFAQTK
jgi:hypothetical protein